MPELTLYDIQARSGFHLGQRGVGQEESGVTIPADTLFAALITTLVELGYNPDELVSLFPRNDTETTAPPPFLLTSAFPRAGAVRFYPIPPLTHLKISQHKLDDHLKTLKRIRFVSEAIFRRAIAGESLDNYIPPQADESGKGEGVYRQGAALWLSQAEADGVPGRVWQLEKTPRVTVDRWSNASNIYHTGRVSFAANCGLWFGIAWQKPDQPLGGQSLQALVELCLQHLSDVGIGGERATGYGHFALHRVDQSISWPNPRSWQPFLSLSRYHPRHDELPDVLQDWAAYKLVSVSGWLYSPVVSAQRRRRLRLLAEGSVVKAVGTGPWGDITDVRPIYTQALNNQPSESELSEFPHPVWRYGLACPVGLKGDVS